MWDDVNGVILTELHKQFDDLGLIEYKTDDVIVFNTGSNQYLIKTINSSEGRIKFLLTQLTSADDYLSEELLELFINKESFYYKSKNGYTTKQNVMYADVKNILTYDQEVAQVEAI